MVQTRSFAAIGPSCPFLLSTCPRVVILYRSPSSSFSLLRTFFYSPGSRTGSATAGPLLWAAVYKLRNTIQILWYTMSHEGCQLTTRYISSRTKWYGDNMVLDKMVWGQNCMQTKWYRAKWHGQNGIDKTAWIRSIYQSCSHWQYDFFINPSSTLTPLGFLCVLITLLCDFWLLEKHQIHLNYNLSPKLLPFCPYHSVCTIISVHAILSNIILSVYHFGINYTNGIRDFEGIASIHTEIYHMKYTKTLNIRPIFLLIIFP